MGLMMKGWKELGPNRNYKMKWGSTLKPQTQLMKPKCDEEKSNLEGKPKTLPSKRKVEVLDDKMIEETLLKKKKLLLVDT